MKLTAEDIIGIINEEIEWLKDGLEQDRAQVAMFDPMKPMNNKEYADVMKWYRLMQTQHNHIINLQILLNHIEAAESEKK